MKSRLFFYLPALLLFFAAEVDGQIRIAPYAFQVSLNMNDLATYTAPAAESDCGVVTVSQTDLLFSGGCAGTLERSYLYTDACGASSKAQVYISLQDTDAPEIAPLPEHPLEVDEKNIPLAPNLVVTDNSGIEVDIEFAEKITEGYVLRTWVCTDACGNKSEISQRMKLR